MSISAVASTPSATASLAAARVPQQMLGQEDFLKLLVAQLTSQDPLNPQKDAEFIAQMASFSSLEQTKAMQNDLASLRAEQQLSQANALIGRQVELQATSDLLEQGTVTAVIVEDGTPMIVVNGQAHPLSELRSVTGPAANPNPA